MSKYHIKTAFFTYGTAARPGDGPPPCPGSGARNGKNSRPANANPGQGAKEEHEGFDMLTLPIKKQWFDMIASGEKTEEYRDLTPYYAVRFANVPKFQADGKSCCHVLLRAGYRQDSPILAIRCWIDKGKGLQEWGAEPGKEYFRLHIVWVSHYLNAYNIRWLQDCK